MGNYSAVVTRITNIRNHSNASRLVCTTIFGNNVIVGIDTKIDDVGIYFPLESQIGKEFAEENDLIRRKDENGKPAGGLFDDNRRVRAQTLRGEKSMGFWIPIESLQLICDEDLHLYNMKEGQEIDQIAGKIVSQKYVPRGNPAPTRVAKGKKARESKILPNQFHFHFDTAQLGRNLHKISPEDQVVITWKMHGTSAIVSNCLVKKPIGFISKLARFLGLPIKDAHYEYIYASRRVIKNEFAESKNHFYDEDLWTAIGKSNFEGKLTTGETVYYEVVGFTPGGKPIQGGYDYGCDPAGLVGPQNRLYVYRITRTSPDGTVTELQWNQVKERTKELGLSTVPEIFYGEADITYPLLHGETYPYPGPPQPDTSHQIVIDVANLPEGKTLQEVIDEHTGFRDGAGVDKWRDEYLAFLQMRYVYDQDSIFCANKVPEEGICVRKEGLVIEIFKLKSFAFLQHETKQLDKGEVDTETAQS